MRRFRQPCIAALLALLAAGGAAALPDCGMLQTPADLRASLEPGSGLRPPPGAPRDEGPWQVRTAVHIVRTDEGQGGLDLDRLFEAFEKLNEDFLPSGIQFVITEPIDTIDSDAFYYDIDTQAEIDQLRLTNPVDQAMNIWFTENMPFCGISSFSWMDVQGIVMVNGCTVSYWNPSTFTHEVGHYFNLLHTHETAYGAECADGSNCATAGDLLCGTPADPDLAGCGGDYCVDADCVYQADFLDPCNGEPYAPDTRNMMSYSRPLCRDGFTPDQFERAAAVLTTVRADHILNPVGAPAPEGPRGPGLEGPSPNPGGGGFAYWVRLESACTARVRVLDVAGRQVAEPLDRRLEAGTHRFRWDPPPCLPGGVYFLELRAAGGRETRRLVLLR